jgi:hypothetical protein
MEKSDPWLLVGSQFIAFVAGIGTPRKFLLDETIEDHTFRAMQFVETVHGVSPTAAVVSRPPLPCKADFLRWQSV